MKLKELACASQALQACALSFVFPADFTLKQGQIPSLNGFPAVSESARLSEISGAFDKFLK